MKIKSFLLFWLFSVTTILAQDLPVVYVYPFEMSGNQSYSLNQRLYSYFCSSLSATDRIRLFSQEAWKKIIQTERLILTINDVRNSEKAIRLGELTPVDYIIVGNVDLQRNDIHFHVEWINLHNGLIEKTISHKIKTEQNLQALVDLVMEDLIPFVIKEGKVIKQSSDNKLMIKVPPLAGWLIGDEFVLVNNLNYGYGRVRILSFDGIMAMAEVIYLNDQISPGDKVVFSRYFQNKKIPRLPVYLPDFKSSSVPLSLQEMKLICRQILIESGKFSVIEAPISGPYYEFRFSFNEELDGHLILISLSVIELPQNKIIYEKSLECIPPDCMDGVKTLLAQALNRWEKKALVSRVINSEIMINKGKNDLVRKGQKILFRSEEDGGIIAKSEVAEVFPEESRIKVPEVPVKIRTGMLVTFVDSDYSENSIKQRLQIIHRNTLQARQKYSQERKEQEEHQKLRQQKEKMRTMLKSRIRIGYSQSFPKTSTDNKVYDFKNSPKMELDIYIGGYPYFNVALNYEYQHLEFLTRPQKVFINTIGGGFRLQSPDFGPFSLYGITLYQLSFFDTQGNGVMAFTKDQWKNHYFTIRLGFDFKIDSGFALYVEAGDKRLIKSEILKLKYYSGALGVSLWF